MAQRTGQRALKVVRRGKLNTKTRNAKHKTKNKNNDL
jgi:hypothetical protein